MIDQSKRYSTHPPNFDKSFQEKMFSTKQDLTPTMAEPKRENLFQTMFTSLTNFVKPIFFNQFVKFASINNLTNVNNALSVTIVPNEGIISHEFFKSLTGHKDNMSDNTSDNMYIQSVQTKTSSMDFVDAVRLNSKLYIPTDEFLGSMNDTKSPILDDFDLCFEETILHEKAFDNIEIIRNLILEKNKSESISIKDSIKDKIIIENEIISTDKIISLNNLENSTAVFKESIQEKTCSSNPFSNMWHKVVNGLSDHLGSFSLASEACTNKHQATKTRRKTMCVSSRRGRGRGRSQLRRNGVSQTRLRKKRKKLEIHSNIQDDIDSWEDFEAHTIPFGSFDKIEELDCSIDIDINQIEVEESSCSLNFEVIDIPENNQKENVRFKADIFSMKVNYVPECSLEEREANCTIDKIPFHSRLISDSSDSEDSFIVFDTKSESDEDDFICFEKNEASDSESSDEETSNSEASDSETSDSETSDSETENETENERPKIPKVRFDLNPTIHTMIKWNFAYRAARPGPWEEMARDRERFRQRITRVGRVLGSILASDFRTEIWKERFAAKE